MPRASSSRSRRRFRSTTPRSVGCTGGSTQASVVCTTRSKPYSPTVDEGHRSRSFERFAYGRRAGAVRAPPLHRKPPLPFVEGHGHLHHLGWPCHAYGPSALLRRIPVFILGRPPDDYLTRLRGERSRDGTESFDARAVFGQQQHPLSRIGHQRRPVLAERHLCTNCIGLEPARRLGDLSGQDLDRLAVNSAPIPYRGLDITLRYTPNLIKGEPTSGLERSWLPPVPVRVSKNDQEVWDLHRDALVDIICYFEHKCTTQHTTAEQSRSYLRGIGWKQRATTGCSRGRTGTSSRLSQKRSRSTASCAWPKRTSGT